MILGILSDTHSLLIPRVLIDRLKSVDLIIHAGDICDVQTLKGLKKLAPVKAVQGNMDNPELKKQLPLKESLTFEGVKIGVTHGHQGPCLDALKNAEAAFKDDPADIVIFGHSHQALKDKRDKTLFFNPGSPNDTVRTKFFSYGLITLEAGKIKAEIIKL